jgi:hypothetical protein
MRNALIGRPSIRLIDAALSANGQNADYLVLGNVDMRSAADEARFTTIFQQGTINIDHEFSRHLPDARDLRREPSSVNKIPRLAGRIHPPELGLAASPATAISSMTPVAAATCRR